MEDNMKKIKIIFAFILLSLFFLQNTQLFAADEPVKLENIGKAGVFTEAGLGIGSVLLSAVYSPLKVSYSLLGMVGAGLAYGLTLGNNQIAKGILDTACRGTYVITPKILTAEEPLHFVGNAD